MSYLILFFLVVIEGPIATLTAAAMAAADPRLDIGWIFCIAVVANMTADACWYLLGAAGKHGRILQYIPWLKNQSGLVDRASQEMRKQGVKVFVLTKLGFGLGTIPLLIAAGILNFNWKRLLGAAIGTEFVWTGALCLIGYQAWAHLNEIIGAIELAVPWLSLLLILFLALYLIKQLLSPSRGHN